MAASSSIDQIQQEVAYVNSIGVDLLIRGKLRSAAFHFNLGLEKMKPAKQLVASDHEEELRRPAAASFASFPLRSCQPMSIDCSCFEGSRWELVASQILIYNSALVQFRCGAYEKASELLQLSIKLSQRELTAVQMHSLLSSNPTALTVMASIYIALAQTFAGAKADQKKVDRALTVASGLLSRYKFNTALNIPIARTRSDEVKSECKSDDSTTLVKENLIQNLRRPNMVKEGECSPRIITNARAC